MTIEYRFFSAHPVAWLNRTAKEVLAEYYPGYVLQPCTAEAAPRSLRSDAIYGTSYFVVPASSSYPGEGFQATLTEIP